MGFLLDAEATRSTLLSVDTTLSENINATQDYIPVTSTTGFSTSVVAEIETTNEVVSFATITENLFLYSQNFANGYWSKNNSVVNATGAVAPDGTSTAEGIRENTSTTSHNIIRNSITAVSGQKYVISVFAKWTGQRYLQINTGSGGVAGNPHQNFDIENGVLGSSNGTITGTITDAGNGWYRCSVVVTSQVTAGLIPVYGLVPSTTSNRAPSYTGQGVGAGDMFLLWGAQIEKTDSITGYLPTTTSSLKGLTTVTRGVNGTTAASASSGDSIQQLPFSFQGVTANGSSTLSENIDASQDYIPVASTSGFATGVDATIESTNEVVSFNDISENRLKNSTDFSSSNWTALTGNMTVNANSATAPDGTTTAASIVGTGSGVISQMGTVDMISVVSSKMTFSAFVKGTGFLQFYTNTFWISTGFVNINAADGTIGSSFIVSDITSTDVGNGWFRIKFSAPSSTAQTNGMMFVGSVDSNTAARATTRTNTETNFIWGWQFEDGATASTILPTGATIPLFGLTTVTRGVNGTTAASALSGATISQAPSLTSIGMSLRLRALSVCSDGAGVGRLTLCNNNGDTLCDVDIPDDKVYTLEFGGGIVFPNGIFISNTDNITSYTLYTDKFSGNGLTAGA